MKEIEVKAKVKDLNDLTEKLEDFGCQISAPIVQKDKIFLHKDSDFKKYQGKVFLRIRNANGKYILTLKKQLENELDNIEKEFEISDPVEAEQMLELMDYQVTVKVNKVRKTCKYKDMTICLDQVEELGDFVEVEKLVEEGESLKIQEELFQFLQSLGIDKDDQVLKGYDTMIYNLEK